MVVLVEELGKKRVQEHDIEIKPTKLVRGNALCKSLVEDQQDEEEDTPKFLIVSLQDPQFSNIAYFLTYGECPNGLTAKKSRDLKTKAFKYVIHDDVLYKRAIDGTFLRCVDKDQKEKLLKSFHNGVCGGNFFSTITTFKILRKCYYW